MLTPVLGVLGGSRTRAVSDLDAAPPTKLGYEDVEPPPGAGPGHPPYEGGAAAVRGGVAAGAGVEPRLLGSGPSVLPDWTTRH